MAREFADEEAIIGWQIDNEIYEGGDGCFCPCCRSGFSEYLRGRYGDIDALNRAWNLNLFSQWYDSFEEVPQPRDAWHNPHLRFEYRTLSRTIRMYSSYTSRLKYLKSTSRFPSAPIQCPSAPWTTAT